MASGLVDIGFWIYSLDMITAGPVYVNYFVPVVS
jgi:hypothetical protein